MTPTITIKEAATLLEKKDPRSVKRFCEKNNVPIFLESGSRKKYIMRMQFEYAKYSKFIKFLQAKYKDKWFEMFHAYTNMNFKEVVEMEESGKGKITGSIDKYQVVGSYEKKFNERLTNLIRE